MKSTVLPEIKKLEGVLAQIENEIGLTFRDKDLLLRVFVHSSFINENRDSHLESNERLEFLGDAVIGHVIAYHYLRKVSGPPQELTDLRIEKVKKAYLAKVAERIGMGGYRVLGGTEVKGRGWKKPKLLADCFEALAGAVFLDQGYAVAETFVLRNLMDEG